jgi:hypothetical protein
MALAPVQLISDFMEDYPNYWLKFYEQGTTTPIVMAIDKTGGTTVAKAEISAGPTPPLGLIKTAGGATFIPYVNEAYDAYIFPTEAEADANDTVNAIQLADDVSFLQNLPNSAAGATKASMVANTSLNIGDFVDTVGYAASGDGGDNSYEIVAGGTGTADDGSFIDLNNGNQAKALFPKSLHTIRQWGAVGTADDTAFIQAAIDYIRTRSIPLHFPNGDYVVTADVVVAFGNSVTLLGDFDARDTRGPRILTNFVGSAFRLETPTTVRGISFVNTGAQNNPGTIGVTCHLTTNSDDMDCWISQCEFKDYEICVDSYGRGLRVRDNLFEGSENCVVLNWDSQAEDFPAQPNNTDLPFGYRAFDISRNRFHLLGAAGFAIQVINDTGFDFFRGAIISGNQLDLTGQLFKGAANNCTFSGNVIDINNNTSSARAIIQFDGPVFATTIIGNTFGGFIAAGANVATITGDRAIMFNDEVKSVSITGNAFNGFLTFGIQFGVSADIDGLSIVGNAFRNITGIAINGNTTFNNYQETGNSFVNVGTQSAALTITGVGSVSNAKGQFFHETYQMRDPTTSALTHELRNDTGIGTYATPGLTMALDADDAVTPFTDNDLFLGSASKRWKEIFAINDVINQSDERLKDLEDISASETACATEIRDAIKKYRWLDMIEEKGDSARYHFGVGAQTIKSIFESHGLDPDLYSVLCYDEWEDVIDKKGNIITPAGNRYGVRYSELCIFMMSSL